MSTISIAQDHIRAPECKRTKTSQSQHCQGKHHTFLCEKTANVLLTTNYTSVTYSVLVLEVEGIKCRPLIDTGVGSSYASSNLIKKLKDNPIRK